MKQAPQEYIARFPLDQAKPHPENPRQGDVGAIYESIQHHGFYGTLIIQRSTGYILAGNHRFLAAEQHGATDLPALVLDVDDDEARRILLVDNRTNDLAAYDDSGLAALLQQLVTETGTLAGTGFDGDDLDQLLADLEGFEPEEEGPYTRKVIAPIYEPTGEKPDVTDLMDDERTRELRAEVEAAEIPPDVAAFLLAAAERHTRFDFGAIAEFYAHADPDVQRLMERSALVIIDFDQAVEQGFVRLNDEVTDLFQADHPDA